MDEEKNRVPEEEKDPREKNIKSLKLFWCGLSVIFLVISAVRTIQIGNVSGFVMTAVVAIILVADFLLWNWMPKDVGFYGVGRAVLIGLVICSFFLNTGFGNFGRYVKQLSYVESHGYYIKHFPPKEWEGMELLSIQYRPKTGINAVFHIADEGFFEQMIARTAHETEVFFTLEEYQKSEINETAYAYAREKVNKGAAGGTIEPYFYIDGEVVGYHLESGNLQDAAGVEVYIIKSDYRRKGSELRAVVVDRNENKIEYISRKF